MKKFIAGLKFGKLLVLSDDFCDLNRTKIVVRCDCGTELEVNKSNLTRGSTQSCGQRSCWSLTKNEVGKTFGYLTVLELDEGKSSSNQSAHWKCKCVCGKQSIVRGTELRSGKIKSCGCKSRFLMSEKLNKGFGESNLHQLFTTYKFGAKKRKIEFVLSEPEFRGFLFNRCHYCGREPYGISTKDSCLTEGGKQIIKYNGIDRVDNDKGYVIDNCITCCKICNFAKRSMSYENFISWLNDVASFRKNLLEKKVLQNTESENE